MPRFRPPIVLHEIARHAGGRCRSYFEPALGLTIDNGNHLLLSANDNALSFLKTIGSEGRSLPGLMRPNSPSPIWHPVNVGSSTRMRA